MKAALLLLRIYPNDVSPYHEDTCPTMFIAVLLDIARNWKQYRCPSTEEPIQKLWSNNTVEYHLVIKKKSIMNFECKWNKKISS